MRTVPLELTKGVHEILFDFQGQEAILLIHSYILDEDLQYFDKDTKHRAIDFYYKLGEIAILDDNDFCLDSEFIKWKKQRYFTGIFRKGFFNYAKTYPQELYQLQGGINFFVLDRIVLATQGTLSGTQTSTTWAVNLSSNNDSILADTALGIGQLQYRFDERYGSFRPVESGLSPDNMSFLSFNATIQYMINKYQDATKIKVNCQSPMQLVLTYLSYEQDLEV